MRKIKLQKVHLDDVKPLSRTELKNVFGGNIPTSPGGDTGCSYKCCSDRNPQICSEVITVTTQQSGTVSCSAGSHLVSA